MQEKALPSGVLRPAYSSSPCSKKGCGFRVLGSGFWVQVLGFGVQGLGLLRHKPRIIKAPSGKCSRTHSRHLNLVAYSERIGGVQEQEPEQEQEQGPAKVIVEITPPLCCPSLPRLLALGRWDYLQ